jgi:hypothetical protein
MDDVEQIVNSKLYAVLGFNLLGDGFRDLLDPKLSRTRNPHYATTQTHKKRTNDLTGNLKPIYL